MEFRLHLQAPKQVQPDEARSSFYWLPTQRSTVIAMLGGKRFGPKLGAIGQVPDRNIDLVRIAVAVYCADRSMPRSGGGANWNRRPIALTVPVLDVEPWEQAADDLKAVIDLLTGDDWTFEFVHENTADEEVAMPVADPARVVLLSGGADSTVGALHSRTELGSDEAHALVSHFSSTALSPLQASIEQRVAELVPGPNQIHLQFHIGRTQRLLDSTTHSYGDEPSSRSRSLLFLALAMAFASIHRVPVWIPENGFASLNPPLGRQRLGSVSTRTTHPAFLADLGVLVRAVGGHAEIANPFADMTKGEMFTLARKHVGKAKAAELLSATHSCAHTGQRSFGYSTMTPCGVCFGCVVRRASFLAAGLPDRTEYMSADGRAEVQAWLDRNSIETAVQRFARRGVRPSDVASMGLPEDYPIATALDLCRRGVAELGALYT